MCAFTCSPRQVNNSAGLGMLRAQGSLFIDVFDRHGYTADANAMLVGLLEDFAEAEQAAAVPPRRAGGREAAAPVPRAAALLQQAARVRASMQARLWARAGVGRGGGDHFVTALLGDNSSIYDMMDYDSNLIAVAHGCPADVGLARRVLQRVDAGNCTAVKGAGPQFASEGCYEARWGTK